MNRRSFLGSMVAVGGSMALRRTALGQDVPSSPSPSTRPATVAEQAEAIRTAAGRFLQTLSPESRNRLLLPFPTGQIPTAARFAKTGGGGPRGFAFVGEKYGQAVWSNFPVSDVPRPGVRMGQFTGAERHAAHALLQATLSPMGYQKVLDIMAADQKVADGGTPYASGLDAYTLALLGQPSATTPWMLQFGGHHLGLNVTFVGDRAVCAPLHTGILPSKFERDGQTIRGLGRENDKAFDLVATLSPDQLKIATIDHDVSDLVFGPGRPDATLSPQGLRGDAMTAHQQDALFSLASEWVGMLNDALAGPRLAEVRQSLPDTRFAWSGPTTHEPGMNGESYFRVHGPTLLIEHAPQGNQGGYKWHVHTVMRDLGNDYGKRLI